MNNDESLKWHQKPIATIIFLIFFFPVGLYLMWRNELWSKNTRIVISIIFGLLLTNAANKNNGTKSGIETSQYSFEENGVAALITIGDKNLCNIITVAGEFKSISKGTYSVQGNTIIFNWDNLGPSDATISNQNGQEILIVNGPQGPAIYKKNKQ